MTLGSVTERSVDACLAQTSVGRATQSMPLQMAQTAGATMAVASWRNPPVKTALEPPDRHLLIFHRRGSTAVEATIGTRLKACGSRIGSVTFVPAGTPSNWHLQGSCDVVHVYLEPYRLRSAGGAVQALAPAFARQDMWLKHWFGMLIEEMAAQKENRQGVALLLADEFEALLVSHLTADMSERQPHRGGLPGGALRRIDEFVQAHLAVDFCLADMASSARLSESHFIRAFRQSTGCTPWQYVLDWRFEVAESLLAQGMAASEAAGRVGLRSSKELSRLYRQRRGNALRSIARCLGDGS